MASGRQSAKNKNVDENGKGIDHIAKLLAILQTDSKYKNNAELAFSQWNYTLLEIATLRSKENTMSSDKRIEREKEKDMRIISLEQQDIYHFCTTLFDQQSQKLEKHVQDMFSVMTDPVFQIDGQNSVRGTPGKYITAQISVRKDGSPTDASDEAKKEAMLLIKKFQKTMTTSSTSDLFELYCVAHSLKWKSEWIQHVTSSAPLQKFASKLLKLMWLMISQDPPICLKWLEPETKVDKNSFAFYMISGDVVRRTIWPAVYLHSTGPLMAKGVVQTK